MKRTLERSCVINKFSEFRNLWGAFCCLCSRVTAPQDNRSVLTAVFSEVCVASVHGSGFLLRQQRGRGAFGSRTASSSSAERCRQDPGGGQWGGAWPPSSLCQSGRGSSQGPFPEAGQVCGVPVTFILWILTPLVHRGCLGLPGLQPRVILNHGEAPVGGGKPF